MTLRRMQRKRGTKRMQQTSKTKRGPCLDYPDCQRSEMNSGVGLKEAIACLTAELGLLRQSRHILRISSWRKMAT
jgi:hypothetical protein